MTNKTRIAIVGSRKFPNPQMVEDYVNQLPDNVVLVSGGAYGVDAVAERAARHRGLECDIYPAEWSKHGNSAGMIRNGEIIKNADYVVAFWDGSSPGTKNTIQRALQAPHVKRVTVYKQSGE